MKILIVDDTKETRESLHNIIKVKIDSSYEIEEAEDGLEALGIVESFKPDIVLTDVLMPKMDGIRFTSILKSQIQTKHIFIAAITGLSGEEQIEKIYDSGADFYISKPFNLNDIVARLKVITSLVTHKSSISKSTPSKIYNCYNNEPIKNYFTTFSIKKEDDLFSIFDYFLNQKTTYNSILLKDFMVILVKAYRKMDVENAKFDLIIEESNKYIYITITDESFIHIIDNSITNTNELIEFERNANVFSFRIDMVLFTTNSSKDDKLYQNELIGSSEMLISCTDEIEEYTNELKEDLENYKSLRKDDFTYNDSMKLMLTSLFDKYIMLFNKLPEFDRVFLALQSVDASVKRSQRDSFSKSQNTEIIRHIDELNLEIEEWIDTVIIRQECKDVHYKDFKIVSICSLLEEDLS